MAELNEVVISGIGGLFPESNNVDELKNLLFNKMNGITVDSRRWNPSNEILLLTAGFRLVFGMNLIDEFVCFS